MNIKYSIYWDLFVIGLTAVVTFFAVGMLLSIPLCLLWNWLMPHIFGLPTINILEAFGLSALITFLSPQQIKFNKKPKIDNDKVNQELENIFTDFKSHFDA
tara:strand:+ start:271 stop:573 length:303 start_codon:yes stop_codon:yes gene_type:complete